MKIALFLVVLIPLALARPDKRNIVGDILHKAMELAHVNELVSVVHTMVNNLGRDETESKCEEACPNLFHNAIGQSLCKVSCKGFQEVAHHFDIPVPA